MVTQSDGGGRCRRDDDRAHERDAGRSDKMRTGPMPPPRAASPP